MILLIIPSFFLCLGHLIPVASTNEDAQNPSGILSGGRYIGELIGIQQHPAMASIEHHNFHSCAGSIISKSTVLTSFQCSEYPLNGLSVRVGTSVANEGGSKHKVIVMRRHERFNRTRGMVYNDLSLLKVSPPFEFGRFVWPIPLLSKNHVVVPYSSLKIAGWMELSFNSSRMLRSARLQVVGCSSLSRLVSLNEPLPQFCTIPQVQNVTEVCQDDIGAPVVEVNHLIAIVSSGKRCINSQDQKYFTHLADYRNWIDENVQIMESIPEDTDLYMFLKKIVGPNILDYWRW